MLPKIISKNLHILEDEAKGCASAEIEQVIVNKFVWNMEKITLNWAQFNYDLNEFKEYEKNQVQNR